MIVITGATGNVGRPLVQALSAAGEQVTAVSRHATTDQATTDQPAAASVRADRAAVLGGVRAYPGDLSEPTSLEPVLDGAKAVFLLTSADFLAKGDLRAVMEVVRAAGVPRVVLLSSQGVGTGRHPAALEEVVKAAEVDWTILRPGNFASNAFQWADSVRTQRTMAAPFGDVALPAVDPQDIAEVAAAALRDPGHAGRTYTLTGPAPISPRQQAEVIGKAVGAQVQFVELSRDDARRHMLTFMPGPVVDTTLDILGTPTAEEQVVSPAVEQILGRPANTFSDWLQRNAAAFR